MDTWGLERAKNSGNAASAGRAANAGNAKASGKRAPLAAGASHAAHKGIVWLHASAIAVWLLVALILGALLAAGKPVPPVVILTGVGAALGHTLFLATHLLLARSARKRAARSRAAA